MRRCGLPGTCRYEVCELANLDVMACCHHVKEYDARSYKRQACLRERSFETQPRRMTRGGASVDCWTGGSAGDGGRRSLCCLDDVCIYKLEPDQARRRMPEATQTGRRHANRLSDALGQTVPSSEKERERERKELVVHGMPHTKRIKFATQTTNIVVNIFSKQPAWESSNQQSC